MKEKDTNPTVNDVFEKWIAGKIEFSEISRQSYDRYRNQYIRFFTNACYPMADHKIKFVSELDMEAFIKTVVVELKLSQKAYYDMRTIIKGIWRFAKKHNYTDISITNCLGDLEISKRMFAEGMVCLFDSLISCSMKGWNACKIMCSGLFTGEIDQVLIEKSKFSKQKYEI